MVLSVHLCVINCFEYICLCVINGLECMPVFWKGANLCFKIRQARNPGKCIEFVVHEKLYVARNMSCAQDHGKYVVLVFHDQYVNRVMQENVLRSCFTRNCSFSNKLLFVCLMKILCARVS